MAYKYRVRAYYTNNTTKKHTMEDGVTIVILDIRMQRLNRPRRV